jgi:hypothetical protein
MLIKIKTKAKITKRTELPQSKKHMETAGSEDSTSDPVDRRADTKHLSEAIDVLHTPPHNKHQPQETVLYSTNMSL